MAGLQVLTDDIKFDLVGADTHTGWGLTPEGMGRGHSRQATGRALTGRWLAGTALFCPSGRLPPAATARRLRAHALTGAADHPPSRPACPPLALAGETPPPVLSLRQDLGAASLCHRCARSSSSGRQLQQAAAAEAAAAAGNSRRRRSSNTAAAGGVHACMQLPQTAATAGLHRGECR